MSIALPVPHEAQESDVQVRFRLVVERCEPELQPRVALLLDAAAETIHLLQELQLVPLEDPDSVAQDLSAWEELAPVMEQTISSVNRLVEVAEQTFPSPPQGEEIDGLDNAFGPADENLPPVVHPEPEGAEAEITSITQAVSGGLRSDVARLGERLRNPTVVADRWNLVSDLLEFRGRLRAAVGELIYQVASSTAEVDRAVIVPGYAEDLSAALLLRQAAANVSFLFRGHAKRIAGTTEDRLPAALQDAVRDLLAFSRTRALPLLRTADKRIFLETRARLVRLTSSTGDKPGLRAGRETVENLARFFDSLSVISRREVLKLHDRSRLAAVGRDIEAAESALGDPVVARERLTSAVEAANALYGRDLALDAYLRAQRHFPVEWLADGELAPEVNRLAALVMGIARP